MLYKHIVHALPPTILSRATTAAFCCCWGFMVYAYSVLGLIFRLFLRFFTGSTNWRSWSDLQQNVNEWLTETSCAGQSISQSTIIWYDASSPPPYSSEDPGKAFKHTNG